jgi:hypothetical protein
MILLRGGITLTKKRKETTVNTFILICVAMIIGTLIGDLPIHFGYRMLIVLVLIFFIKPLEKIIKKVAGKVGLRKMNGFLFWGLFFVFFFLCDYFIEF